MSNQKVVLPNASAAGGGVVAQSQFSQRQSSRCNNKSIHSFMDFQPQGLTKQAPKENEVREDQDWKNQLKLKRDNGLTFKALINGVSPNNQQQNANTFNNTNEKVFNSFQQNNINGQLTGNNGETGSQVFLQNKAAVGNSQEVEIKALNGFLPMVNSQQLMTQKNSGQQQRPVGLMAAKAHLLDPTMEQRGLGFAEFEYKNYPGTQQIQKQLVNQNCESQVQSMSYSQHHANSVKLEKQIKLDMKQQSLHFQANQVNGFNSSNRDDPTTNVQTLKKQLPDEKLNHQIGQHSTNSKVDKQRRKLLFEYGLEKNFQNGNVTNGSGQFPLNTELGSQVYSSKSNGMNGPNLKGMSGQAQLQPQRYGIQNSHFGGAVKGSSLGHYQQQVQTAISSQANQRTPESLSKNQGHVGSDGTGRVPNSATQQSGFLKSAGQAQLKQSDRPVLINQNNNNNNNSEFSGAQRKSVVKQEHLTDNKFQQHFDQQTSKGNLQNSNGSYYMNGISSAVPYSQNNTSTSAQRKQNLQNAINQHKFQNQPGSMGLLEQLVLNLKAINIDKLDEKEQEQLRFLSNQYQYHLNQFQEYQKQQILNGNFELLAGGAQSSNQVNQSVNSTSKTQSTIRNNNQSGFSGRFNDQLSVQNQNSQPNPKIGNGSSLEEVQGKSQQHNSDQKPSEIDAFTNVHGHAKQQSASVNNNAMSSFNNVYASQERFVQNEKNLRDMRLKKSKQRNENTPGQSVAHTEQNCQKPFGSSGNNTGVSANGAITSDISSGSPFFKDSNKDQDTSKSTIMNGQSAPQVNSQKNLNRNVSHGRVNDKTQHEMNTSGLLSKAQVTPPVGLPGPKTSTIGDLPFSFHLNLPHPVPQINSQDIKNLSANQRCAIFKHLQKREKSKFLGIQQNKMKAQEKQIQVKFTQQRFRSKQLAGGTGGPLSNVFDKGSRDRSGGYMQNESRANGISVGGSGTGMRAGMSRFVSVGQRGQRDHNGKLNNVENDLASQAQFDKQMENLRRQWASDLRAFGIFQQNELWQFSQMNDQQQKQILICNLQQGKFQSLIDEQYEVLMQKYAQQSWLNERNNNLNQKTESKPKGTTNENANEGQQQDISQQQNKQRRHTYGSALSQIGKDTQDSNERDSTAANNDQSTTNPSKQQSYRNSLNLDKNETAPESQGQSFTESEKKHQQLLINGGEPKRSLSPQKEPTSNNVDQNQKRTPTDDTSKKDAGDIYSSDKEKTININFNDIEKRQNQFTDDKSQSKNQSNHNDGNERNQQQSAFLPTTDGLRHPFQSQTGYSTGAKDKQRSRDNHLEKQDANNNTIESKQMFNPVQKRYEDSKDSFQECLREILCKYQNQINLSHISGTQNGKIDNLLPNFAKNLMNRNHKDGMINDIGALKHRQSESAKNNLASNFGGKGNLNTISNDKYGLRGKVKPKVNGKEDPKKKDQTIIAPNSTKSGAKKIGIDGKEVEDDADGEEPKEAIVEEVKKPRYFPPKRLPNPFESAAQEQERFIQARKEALIKYSNISKNRYKQDDKEPFKYVIRQGNNSKLISRVMEQSGRVEPRYDKTDPELIVFPGWEPADDYYDSLYHFKWKPTSSGIKYDMISKHGLKQVVNHVKGHGTLTTKDNLFLNLKQFYETQKLNIFETVPITIVLDYLKDDIGTKVEQFQSVLNIIEKNISCDTETLNKKLYEMQLQKEKSVKTPYKISACCHNQQNLWLLKPTGFNRGIGIHLFQNFDQLRDIMCTYYGIGRGARDKSSIFQQHNQNHNPNSQAHAFADPNQKEEKMKNFTFVIQKLVELPMLYFNRKFDIRQWVLLNASDGKVFIFRESYVRTSSREYVDYDPQLPEEDQIYMQLTNNAVQKVGNDYEKYEEGNIVSVHTLFEYIAGQPEAKGRSKQTLENKYKQDIEKMIVETFKSVKGQINCQKHTFELLGYDFILDQDLNTYLIEVNTNPCLEESNELLRKLLPRMVDDTLNIVLDPVFAYCDQQNGRNNDKYKSKFPLRADLFSVENNQRGRDNKSNQITETTKHEGYRDDFNLWKHITNLE